MPKKSAAKAQGSGFLSHIGQMSPFPCDLYTLTMTYALWQAGRADQVLTTQTAFCRSYLDNGDTYQDSATGETRKVKVPYLVGAGLGLLGEFLSGWQWTDRELTFLARQQTQGPKGGTTRMFPDAFLDWLHRQEMALTIKAIPEGELIFPQEPVVQLTGPFWQQELIEGVMLNILSTSTNLATVATQVRLATQREAAKEGAAVIEASTKECAVLSEMSLRRSPSIDGIQSSRAAAIGGWMNSSNTYAGLCYGIPVMGTFAHAWVMLHDTEEDAFDAWAQAYPGAAVFLADTYDTLEGVKTAIRVCKKRNIELKGVRLDSGNLAYLSREVRALLDEAGFPKTRIIASDNITVKTAASLYGFASPETKRRESFVDSFGIGSTLAVNRANPLHDFVMKLAAVHAGETCGEPLVREVIKLSESEKKTTFPGCTDVVRYIDRKGFWAGDTIIPDTLDVGEETLAQDLYSVHLETGKTKIFPKGAPFKRLLRPWMDKGRFVEKPYAEGDAPAILQESRARCAVSLNMLEPAHLLLPPALPHRYGVGVAEELKQKQARYINHLRAGHELERQRARFGILS